MMSFRALARWAPRSTTRIASYTTRTSLRPAFRSTLKPNDACLSQRIQLLSKPFSTTRSRSDETGQELAAKLEKEIDLESANNESQTDSDQNVKSFLGENDFWSLEDNAGEQEVILKRKFDDEDITVAFSIVDFNSPSVMPEDEADEAYMDEEEDVESAQSGGANTKGAVNQGRTGAGNVKVAPEDSVAPADREELRNEEDDYDSQQAFPANVNVLIQRGGKGSLRVHLLTDNGRFIVQSVMHLPENPTATSSSSATSPSTSTSTSAAVAVDLLRHPADHLYTGPPFGQLDEEVQGMLEQYLDARGINTALALFIPDYIDVKEQREYLGWLGRVRGFVAE